jgi:hypothetical protein
MCLVDYLALKCACRKPWSIIWKVQLTRLLYKYAEETNHTPSEIPNFKRDKMSIRTKDGLVYEMFGKVHVYFLTNAFKQSNQNDEIALINA